jgi:hypothetical protein
MAILRRPELVPTAIFSNGIINNRLDVNGVNKLVADITHSPDCVGREPYYNLTNSALVARNYIERYETVKQKTYSSSLRCCRAERAMTSNSLRKFIHIAATCRKLINKIKKFSAGKGRMSLLSDAINWKLALRRCSIIAFSEVNIRKTRRSSERRAIATVVQAI